MLTTQTQRYVDMVLEPAFGGIIEFVKEYEPIIEQRRGAASADIPFDKGRVERLVRGFATSWKKAIDQISGEVMRSFDNFKNGTQILQAALTHLILHYQRFQTVMSQAPFKHLPVRSELVNIHHVMVEVKNNRAGFA